jgi:hypothetical protein
MSIYWSFRGEKWVYTDLSGGDYTRAITPIRGRPYGDFCRAFDAEEGRSPLFFSICNTFWNISQWLQMSRGKNEYVTPVLSRHRFARSTCTWTVSNIPRLTKTLHQSYNDGMVNPEASFFPPEKWVYTSFSPGKISIYSFFPPERSVYTHLSPWFLGGKSNTIRQCNVLRRACTYWFN